LSNHRLDDVPTEEFGEPRRRPGSPLVVVLAGITATTLIVLALVIAGAHEQAESVATLAMLLGAGLAVGFRSQWTRR